MPTLSGPMATAAAAAANVPFWMVYLDVAGDPLWAWTANFDQTFTVASDALLSSGQTFLGLAAVGSVSDIIHSADGRISAMTLSLTHVDFSGGEAYDFVSNVASWSQRQAVVWKGFYNAAAGTVVADPVRVTTARMVHVSITDGAQPGIVLKLAGKSASDGQRASGQLLADAHQLTIWPGDTALRFINQLVGKELRFGQPYDAVKGGAGNSGGSGGITGPNSRLVQY